MYNPVVVIWVKSLKVQQKYIVSISAMWVSLNHVNELNIHQHSFGIVQFYYVDPVNTICLETITNIHFCLFSWIIPLSDGLSFNIRVKLRDALREVKSYPVVMFML